MASQCLGIILLRKIWELLENNISNLSVDSDIINLKIIARTLDILICVAIKDRIENPHGLKNII